VADIVAALFFHEMRWDPKDPTARNVDAFVLSKGHAAPILWATLHEAGAISEDPLSLRRIDSTLEGHPTPRKSLDQGRHRIARAGACSRQWNGAGQSARCH